MKKKMYSRPVSDCMIIALNEVLMSSPGGGYGGLPPFEGGVNPSPQPGDWN